MNCPHAVNEDSVHRNEILVRPESMLVGNREVHHAHIGTSHREPVGPDFLYIFECVALSADEKAQKFICDVAGKYKQ